MPPPPCPLFSLFRACGIGICLCGNGPSRVKDPCRTDTSLPFRGGSGLPGGSGEGWFRQGRVCAVADWPLVRMRDLIAAEGLIRRMCPRHRAMRFSHSPLVGASWLIKHKARPSLGFVGWALGIGVLVLTVRSHANTSFSSLPSP